jgi:epoxyqueuosine reductase
VTGVTITVRERLGQLAAIHGLDLVGVTDASPMPEARAHIEASIAAGRMAGMDWMGGERPAAATNPRVLDPEARSVIVMAASYAGSDRAAWDPAPDALRHALRSVLAGSPADPVGRIARYALGSDYHVSLRDRLEAFAADLRASGLPTGDVAYVDDRPLAERALAARAGLGWIGKNSNLLTHERAGSWVFLGAILSSADIPVDEPVRSSCGSCTRCISGCPTGAIVAAQTIDARRCISYLTIEHRGVLNEWEAGAIGDWLFGCDVCQEVCPVNAEAEDAGPLLVPLLPLIEWLLPMGSRAFGREVGDTALTRAGRHRLLRNAIAAVANLSPMPAAAVPLLRRAAEDQRDEVRQQAEMVLAALG